MLMKNLNIEDMRKSYTKHKNFEDIYKSGKVASGGFATKIINIIWNEVNPHQDNKLSIEYEVKTGLHPLDVVINPYK